MKKEDKELLLKDLCARLPYETRVRYTFAFAGVACINEYSDEGILSYDKLQDFSLYPKYGLEKRRVCNISPYLRPMSSMTDEEKAQVQMFVDLVTDENYGDGYSPSAWDTMNSFVQYCDSHHLDHRGLIFRGLALEAPEGMYNLKEK